MRELGQTSLESTKSVPPALLKLHCFGEIEAAWHVHEGKDKTVFDSQGRSVDRGLLELGNFGLAEPLMALRGVLSVLLGQNDHISPQLCTLARAARKAKRYQIASNAIYQL